MKRVHERKSDWEGATEMTSGAGTDGELLRFAVSVEDEKLTIWFEERESKRQWRTNALEMKEYVDANCTIPQACALDYAERFVECLESDLDQDSDGEDESDDRQKMYRSLSKPSKDGGSRRLELSMKLAVSRFCKRLVFSFTLLPVALDRVDLLVAHVRDLQQEVAELQRLPALPKARASFWMQGNVPSRNTIRWVPANGRLDASRFGVDAEGVVISQFGTYHVLVAVSPNDKSSTSPFVEIKLDGVVVLTSPPTNTTMNTPAPAFSMVMSPPPVPLPPFLSSFFVQGPGKLTFVNRGSSFVCATNSFLTIIEL